MKLLKKTDYRFWRFLALTLAALSSGLALAIVLLLLMADKDAITYRNLSYNLWKFGLWRYDQESVMVGLQRDQGLRNSLLGVGMSEFVMRFPYTFYEVKETADSVPPNQTRLVASYVKSLHPEEGLDGWLATFENGKLIGFDYNKAR